MSRVSETGGWERSCDGRHERDRELEWGIELDESDLPGRRDRRGAGRQPYGAAGPDGGLPGHRTVRVAVEPGLEPGGPAVLDDRAVVAAAAGEVDEREALSGQLPEGHRLSPGERVLRSDRDDGRLA
jgi:hypothetical protein